MTLNEVKQENVGRRVKGVEFGFPVTGVTTRIVELINPVTNKVCSRGFEIRMDKPMHYCNGQEEWESDTYESTARISDGWGNLQHTEFID